jgi:hypothetical protein
VELCRRGRAPGEREGEREAREASHGRWGWEVTAPAGPEMPMLKT